MASGRLDWDRQWAGTDALFGFCHQRWRYSRWRSGSSVGNLSISCLILYYTGRKKKTFRLFPFKPSQSSLLQAFLVVKISFSHPAVDLVHTAVCLSAIVSWLAPLGPRRPIYTVALPAGTGPGYSTRFDCHKIESLTQNTKLYPKWQRGTWSRDLAVQWCVGWECKDPPALTETVVQCAQVSDLVLISAPQCVIGGKWTVKWVFYIQMYSWFERGFKGHICYVENNV